MNAPFHASRAASLRDPFTAFVCDEATAELLRPIAVEHGWSPEKVNKGGLRNAVQTLSVSASPSILFVDLSESGDPLNDINALAEVCEPGTVVIAAGQVNDVRLYRDLVASGIQDYLLKPFSADQLRDAFANAQLTISGPRIDRERRPRSRNVMAAVIGVRGGVGASTIATSLAWLMGDKAGRSTALLDLDVHFGTGALALDLEPGRGLTDAIENPSRIDGLFIERAMVRANDKLCVLSAEAPINQSMLTDGSAFYPAAGRDPPRLRRHGDRSAAQHAGPVSRTCSATSTSSSWSSSSRSPRPATRSASSPGSRPMRRRPG